MEVVHKGRLVLLKHTDSGIELNSIGYEKQSGFDFDELVSKAAVASKLPWEIRDTRQCVEDRTGDDTLFILVSCTNSKFDAKFGLLRLKWKEQVQGCHQSSVKNDVELQPYFEFSFTLSLSVGADSLNISCMLTNGPSAVTVNQNKISLFRGSSDQKHAVQKSEFAICDDEILQDVMNTARIGHEKAVFSSRILFVISEHDWIVSVLLSTVGSTSFLSTISLEKETDSGEFVKQNLDVDDFFPPDYGPKVATVALQSCKRVVKNTQPTYRNMCAVGLNDGYVMTFVDGEMQACVALWSPINSLCPAFAIQTMMVVNDVIVCLADTQDCFAVSSTTGKVLHQWGGIRSTLVGDFLRCGRKQLLLLFDSHDDSATELPLSQPSQLPYLLTDFQGFVDDSRVGRDGQDGAVRNPDDEDLSRSLGKAVSALQEQCQSLTRNAGKEEARLASKQTFIHELWNRLQSLGLDGSQRSHLSPPEVPLVPLLGGQREKAVDKGNVSHRSHLQRHDDLSVQQIFVHVVQGSCVVGVKVLSTSNRELTNCALLVTQPDRSGFAARRQLSSQTRVWQCFHSNIQDLPLPLSTSSHLPPKRQKLETQVSVFPVESIKPSECVTLTCTFDLPSDLSVCGEVKFGLHLQYCVTESGILESSAYLGGLESSKVFRREQGSGEGDTYVPGSFVGEVGLHGDSASKNTQADTERENNVNSRKDSKEGEGRSSKDTASKVDATRHKKENAGWDVVKTYCVPCGQAVVNSSHILGRDFQGLLNGSQNLEPSQDDTGEVILVLSAIQHCWKCDVSFVLHEATVLPSALLNAGFFLHPGLGQYVLGASGPACLRLTRVEILGFHPLPRRAASVLFFARDVDQLLLLCRHLYTHLPRDATISASGDTQNTDTIQHLQRALSTELRQKKRLAKTLLEEQTADSGHSHNSVPAAPGPENLTEKYSSTSDRPKAEVLTGERQAFAQHQLLYHSMRGRNVSGSDIAKFVSSCSDYEAETDLAVAEVKLL